MDHGRLTVRNGPLYKGGAIPGGSTSPGMRVLVPVRPPPLDLADGKIDDTEPPPGPLVLGAEPDLTGQPCRERECPDPAEIVRQEIFVHRVRVDRVPGLPDLHDQSGLGFEGKEICTRAPDSCSPATSIPSAPRIFLLP